MMKPQKLTNKQLAFVDHYIANGFNGTVAARMAGYGGDDHQLGVIAAQNMAKPQIRAAIDDRLAEAHISADEVLQELAREARTPGKNKLRALFILSQYHGLLDGSWQRNNGSSPVEIHVKYETDKRIREYESELAESIEQYNAHLIDEARVRTERWNAVIEQYRDEPIAIEALRLAFEAVNLATTETLTTDTLTRIQNDIRARNEEEAKQSGTATLIILPDNGRDTSKQLTGEAFSDLQQSIREKNAAARVQDLSDEELMAIANQYETLTDNIARVYGNDAQGYREPRRAVLNPATYSEPIEVEAEIVSPENGSNGRIEPEEQEPQPAEVLVQHRRNGDRIMMSRSGAMRYYAHEDRY